MRQSRTLYRLDWQSEPAAFGCAIPAVALVEMTATRDGQQRRQGIDLSASTPRNATLSLTLPDVDLVPRLTGISIRNRGKTLTATGATMIAARRSPWAIVPASPSGSCTPSARTLVAQQAPWVSRCLTIDAGREKRPRANTSVHGLDAGPDHTTTRPIERPWSSSAGTIAGDRHEVRRP